jgi:hypothetical protein
LAFIAAQNLVAEMLRAPTDARRRFAPLSVKPRGIFKVLSNLFQPPTSRLS